MFKSQSSSIFPYWRVSRCDLDNDIDALITVCRCWHTGKWDVGTSVPATQRVGIGASRAKSYLLRRIKIVAHLLPSQADRSALHPSSGRTVSDHARARLAWGATTKTK